MIRASKKFFDVSFFEIQMTHALHRTMKCKEKYSGAENEEEKNASKKRFRFLLRFIIFIPFDRYFSSEQEP